ncbi:MAG TPA: hypothetical protein VJ885_13475, partial [Thermoanaerobaculia bacterium]|nr:hypothetical protein [Thermoanaerobaculia bacterium]
FAWAPVSADTVYLANGRTFEGVIAEVTDNEVKIRMPGGSLSLPRSHVQRVESSDSDFGEYLRRKEAIRRGAKATDWLELARWAKSHGVEHGAREAALAAASLEPRLDGLPSLLRGYGYVLDEQLDRWIPYADSMRRRGFVMADGQWISREEQAVRQRARDEEMERRRADRAATQAAQATRAVREVELALVEMELRDRLRRTEEPATSGGGIPLYAFPGYWSVPVFPGPPHCHNCGGGGGHERPPHHGGGQGPGARPAPRSGSGSFTMHVPGSLIPRDISATSRKP